MNTIFLMVPSCMYNVNENQQNLFVHVCWIMWNMIFGNINFCDQISFLLHDEQIDIYVTEQLSRPSHTKSNLSWKLFTSIFVCVVIFMFLCFMLSLFDRKLLQSGDWIVPYGWRRYEGRNESWRFEMFVLILIN